MSSLSLLSSSPHSASALAATDRAIFRRELRQRRRALTAAQQKIAARDLAQRLSKLPELRRAKRIALYWPVDGEIDPRALASLPHFSRHQFYLPQLLSFPAGQLGFVRWHKNQRQHRNRFGIPEPRGRRAISARKLHAILLPLTGFDAQGNRLGMGGGFYDRTLAFKHGSGHHGNAHPRLIGVAHACQQVARLASADWDVGLHTVVTDRRVFR